MTRNLTVHWLVILLASRPPCVSAQTKPRAIHVFVALADNQHQGIIPVPAVLGNGEDASHNLYWGAAFGTSADWKEVLRVQKPYQGVLERSVFEHRTQNVVLVANAYMGSEIKQALTDFFRTAAASTCMRANPKHARLAAWSGAPTRMRTWWFTSVTMA